MLNFIVGSCCDPCVVEYIFGNEHVLHFESNDLAEMAVVAGVFKSKGQARKAGMMGPAEHGLNLYGTKKNKFWVYTARDDTLVHAKCFNRNKDWFQ